MKTKFKIISQLTLAATFTIGSLALPASAQTNSLAGSPIPGQLQSQLPAGMPPFDPNGLSFTNVNYKFATGTQLATGTGGTLAYAQGDEDLFHFNPVDLGLGQEAELSGAGSGFHSLTLDLELIKNLANWQITGKVGYTRTFEDNVGNFVNAGVDVNYNLAKGTGISWLGTSSGAFTYVGGGVKIQDKDFSLTASQVDLIKKAVVYVGFAF